MFFMISVNVIAVFWVLVLNICLFFQKKKRITSVVHEPHRSRMDTIEKKLDSGTEGAKSLCTDSGLLMLVAIVML